MQACLFILNLFYRNPEGNAPGFLINLGADGSSTLWADNASSVKRFAPHHFANRSEFSLKIPMLFEIRAVRAVAPKFTRFRKSGGNFLPSLPILLLYNSNLCPSLFNHRKLILFKINFSAAALNYRHKSVNTQSGRLYLFFPENKRYCA